MSLRIESTLQYLCARLNISTDKIDKYREKSIVEILEEEAAQGNQEAIKIAADMFTDSDQLIELFQLADIRNKMVIFSEMDSKQKEELLPLLEVEDLIFGLYFFDQDKILEMLQKIPMEELVKVAFQLFPKDAIIDYMPEEEIDKFLTSDKLDKDFVLKNLKEIPDVYLKQMLESVTGEEAEGDTIDLINKLDALKDQDFKMALTNLEKEQKRNLTFLLASSDEKLYENFSAKAYTDIMGLKREKKDIIQSMDVIKPEYLQKMVGQLPDQLLNIVLTQIDAQKLADSLITKYPELLAKFVAG